MDGGRGGSGATESTRGRKAGACGGGEWRRRWEGDLCGAANIAWSGEPYSMERRALLALCWWQTGDGEAAAQERGPPRRGGGAASGFDAATR